MTRLYILILIAFAVIGSCQGQQLAQQAQYSRQKCEQGLRDKGCTGITSSCDFEANSYSCKCSASSCPTNVGSSSNGNRPIRTNGCSPQGPDRCPRGYCCGPASTGSPDNMRICYPPGSPC